MCALGCGGKTEEATNTTKEETKPSKTWNIMTRKVYDFPVYSTGFYNDNVTMTVGYAGEIHYSNDGGGKWNRLRINPCAVGGWTL